MRRALDKELTLEECQYYKSSIVSNFLNFAKTVCEEILRIGLEERLVNKEFFYEVLTFDQETFFNIDRMWNEQFSKKFLALVKEKIFKELATHSKYLLQYDNSP